MYARSQLPLIAGFVASLFLVERVFKSVSAKIIATTWSAAFCAYITVPATKLLVRAPISEAQMKEYLIAFSLGTVVSWVLFYRSNKIDRQSSSNAEVKSLFGKKKNSKKAA